INLRAEDRDVCDIPLPKSPQQVAQEHMLDQLFARIHVMRRVDIRNPILIFDMGHPSLSPECRHGNSLPLRGKSTAKKGLTETALRIIPFWDYPDIGSWSRADGFSRAQTQIGRA